MGIAFKNEQRIDNQRRSMRFDTADPRPSGMLVVDLHNYKVLVLDHSLEGFLLIIDYCEIFESKVADLYLDNEKFLVRICHQRLIDGMVNMGVEILSRVPCEGNYRRTLNKKNKHASSNWLIALCLVFIAMSVSAYIYQQEIKDLINNNPPGLAKANQPDDQNLAMSNNGIIYTNNPEIPIADVQLQSSVTDIIDEQSPSEFMVDSFQEYKLAVANYLQTDEAEQSKCPMISVVLDLKDIDTILEFIKSIPRKDTLKSVVIKFVVSNDSTKSSYVDNYYKQLMFKLDSKHFYFSLDKLRNLKSAIRDNQANWVKFVKTVNQDLQSGRIRTQQDSKSGFVIHYIN